MQGYGGGGVSFDWTAFDWSHRLNAGFACLNSGGHTCKRGPKGSGWYALGG